ncbi:GroES-like protein [Lojkania enalia]|uniref:alcohol dehydrogenase (NADP(+)) n=1 Tax=Lojkania enalia TaxID=147567 RepID=A0A9P4JY31_9PLEO|nr:GroES-like protein [Didymosphaeria enalia]
MSLDYKFEGWLGHDPSSAKGKMQWGFFEPKEWEETDVDIKISHCGICGTDLHNLRSGWGPTIYPCCVGHEIVGNAIRVGSKVEGIHIGDRVGVGAQCDSCCERDCEECSSGNENYCPRKWIGTYNAIHKNGGKSYGGYATYNRSPSRFVFKIPDAIESKHAAPMLCAGITTYAPLKRNNCGPGTKVGIIGFGGLGHFGLMWAKALGAEVTVISRKSDKKDDAFEMGATKFIATAEEENWAIRNAGSLNMIFSILSSSKLPYPEYLSLLCKDGTFIQFGVPEDGPLTIPAISLVMKRVKMTGSLIGSPSEIREMLQFAAENVIKPWVKELPMKDANQAIVDMTDGKARYRYVLVN